MVKRTVCSANVQYACELSKYLANQEWNYFATFTTQYELTLPSARRLMERFHQESGKYAKAAYGEDQRFFWVAEKFQCKDGYHTHGLIRTDASFDILCNSYQLVSAAKREGKHYRVHFSKYNPKQAAAKYCAKYLLKKCSDYDLLN